MSTEPQTSPTRPTVSAGNAATGGSAKSSNDVSGSEPRGKTKAAPAVGGVAPFVGPPSKLAQWQARRKLKQRGFVPLSPGREKRRHRILPRTVIGISSMLLALGVGAAFSGAAFYAYYDNRLAENERQIARFVDGFDQQFTDASASLNEQREEAITQIRDELVPLGEYTTDASGVIGLPATAGPSVWSLKTVDEQGVSVVASAFAITGHQGGTALVTSLGVVRASTVSPSPVITLTKGDQTIAASLWAWDSVHDVALLVTDESIPFLELAGSAALVDALGARVFALSGSGGQGATASPGVTLDRSAAGLQHTAVVGTLFEGGPLLNGAGQVIGVATSDYQPLGIDSGDVHMAPDVTALCSRVLRCAENDDRLSIEPAAEGE